MEPRFEILGPDNWAEYKEILLRTWQSDPTAFASSYAQESAHSDEEWKKKLENRNRRVYGVRVGDTLVACGGVTFDPKEYTSHSATIGPFFTDKEQRGKGYGEALMRGILEDLRRHPRIKKVVLYVNESQQPAKRLYEKCGFRQVGLFEKEACVGGTCYDQAAMELLFPEKYF